MNNEQSGNAAVEALIKLLKDRTIPDEVRAAAATGLGHAAGARAEQCLIGYLEHWSGDAPLIRSAAAIALGYLAAKNYPNGSDSLQAAS